MKLFKTTFITLLLLVAFSYAQAQDTKKIDVVKIKADIKCNSCKEKIEKNIAYEKGVKDLKVDMATKTVTITFKTSKTDSQTLLKAVQKLGYGGEIVKSCKEEASKSSSCKKKKTSCCSKAKK